MKVSVNIESKYFAKLEDLVIIQGDLKALSEENYQKLKLQILDEGFISPFYVWDNEGVYNLLDGTQRKITLDRMRNEGIGMPEQFPIIKIPARNANHAARIILAISSQYGKISEESLKEYTSKFEIYDMTPFSFDKFPTMEIVDTEKVDYSDKNEEINTDNFGNDLEHTCPKCGFEFND